ncbi:calcium:proton antiporter [Cryobacterium sp. Hb1]|uniref:calcium:proton antiporter n=1 Tax=Cryobacterium sp. Hb1 TaxID=1259147 RepID=UPI00106BF9E6|nr:calcium:proton antiporter [Cryobacterium sp. Hb1]TFD65570.1 calcium:proton antiporter [Cryobacterium sp. Hb1]
MPIKRHADSHTPTEARSNDGWRALLSRSTTMTLAIAWLVSIGVLTVGHDLVAHPPSVAVAVGVFLIILAAIMVAAFGVVHQAEVLARKLGEPFGTLVLTLTVVIIEVVLISSIMLGPSGSSTIARDSVFAVMMIIINGVMGLSLLLGGMKHGPQRYNMEGASVYVAMIAVLSLCTLVLPNFIVSTSNGSLVPAQAIAVSVLAAALYGFFIYLQTGKNRALFTQPSHAQAIFGSVTTADIPKPRFDSRAAAVVGLGRGELVRRVLLLVGTVLPIVLLSHDLGILVEAGIAATGAPVALGGVIIAIIVFTPEAMTAVRAALADEGQRTLNLGLGAFVSTVGLTIPTVLIIGLATGQEVILGESSANMVLIAVTLAASIITYFSPRTTALHGAVHLVLFGMFAVLLFAP